jgi:hypothetical protein
MRLLYARKERLPVPGMTSGHVLFNLILFPRVRIRKKHLHNTVWESGHYYYRSFLTFVPLFRAIFLDWKIAFPLAATRSAADVREAQAVTTAVTPTAVTTAVTTPTVTTAVTLTA